MKAAFCSFKQSLAFATLSLAALSGVHAAGDWQTTLQARDINGDGTADAFYDTSLNVTWLAVINAVADTGGNGLVPWASASSWAAQLDVHGVKGWRLPLVTDLGSAGCVQGEADCGANPDVSQSELAHLYYVTLGNQAVPGTVEPNIGPFRRNAVGVPMDITSVMRSRVFHLSDPDFAFNTLNGSQTENSPSSYFAAWAVRSGDVTSVPEGGTFGLMALGLLALSQTRRLRSR